MFRLLKAHDLITSPVLIVIEAANEFKDKTTAINQLWQTDFTCLKFTGRGWYYLSTVLDDGSRYIVAWKLCSMIRAEDVMDTLDLALKRAGLDQVTVLHKPRLLSDNDSSVVAADLANRLDDRTSTISGVRPATRRRKARSSFDVRRSRIASCSSTINCLASLSVRSRPSSSITTMPAMPRVSTL